MRLNVDMDWTQLIQDLIDRGLSQAEIAVRCDTGQSHISGLFRGERKCPNWVLGNRLVSLHQEVVDQRKPSAKEAA